MTLYDNTWPVNFIEQKSLAQQILERAKKVVTRYDRVFLRQLTKPTQSEWEAAYVTQTRQPLPIPPGVKMLWLNLSSGDCTTFISANDLSAGTGSSGEIFPIIDLTYARPAIRLIGYNDTARFPNSPTQGGFIGAGEAILAIPAYVSKNFISLQLNSRDLYQWMNRGLDTLMLFYKLRSTDTVLPVRVQIFWGTESTQTPWREDQSTAVNIFETIAAEVTPAAATTASATGLIAGDVSTNGTYGGSLAGAHSHGVIFIHNLGNRFNSNTEDLSDLTFAPAALNFGTYVATTFATNNLYVEHGVLQKIDEYPQWRNFLSVGTGPDDDVSGKIWLYGIFKKPTEDFTDGTY